MKIIDTINGNFYLSLEEVIGNSKPYSEILTYKSIDRIWNVGNGYDWIYFKNIQIDTLYFFIAICFFEKKVKSIDFSFVSELKSLSWDNWSEADELKKKDVFEFWLNENLGEKRKFDWGNISSHYDGKGGSARIIINYK